MNVRKLINEMKQPPYRLKLGVRVLNRSEFLIKIRNFAHLQISPKQAVSLSARLWCCQSLNGEFNFNDQGYLLRLTTKAVKVIYNLQMGETKVRRINVIPIFSGGLVRYMNDENSMFHYLKPVNKRNSIWVNFKTKGYSNLKRAIAEYAVMALSLVQYAEINLKQLESGRYHEN